MRLDLADLKLFLCIVDAGSITQGAARANLALASASERLRNIEADAGVQLLERHPRGVATTAAGKAFERHARLILEQQSQLKSELNGFASGAQQTLRLFANTSAVSEFLPSRLARWLAAHPTLHVELEERTSSDIVNCLVNGVGEAGIVSDAVDAQGLQLWPLAADNLALIVAERHPLASQKTVQFADVQDQAFIGLYPGSALQEHINAHARRPLALRIRMNTFEGVGEMVAQGIGIGILPLSIAARYQPRYGYAILALADSWAQRQLCFCYRDGAALSPAMQSLLEQLLAGR
ncbi:LysR family transcriptional regulator [Atlantibacter sp.]|uniref:LysR family transcriptional regulator n=1 Tax=Atlantibacter sp. TaxID=1903473 RepID=UPI0028AB412E|nr:LysR family transcriptional regulator [Atlantibacter sp.]